ncbi:MAG: hypothetical protein ACXVH1_26285 [Solirubrobacteraceae bacterium]
MSDWNATPRSVVALYQQLAAERAGAARAALARERSVEGLFAHSAAALEDAAGALLHAAATFIALRRAVAQAVSRAGRRAARGRGAVRRGRRPDAHPIPARPNGGAVSGPAIGSYRDTHGARHELVVDKTADGGWRVLDVDADAQTTHVVETLACSHDNRPQAEAIARDYLTTVERNGDRAGWEPGEAISEQGGRDARTNCRPRTGPRTQPPRGVALPHPAR